MILDYSAGVQIIAEPLIKMFHGLIYRAILANKVYKITLTVYEVKRSNGFTR